MDGIELASIYRLTAINFRMSSVVLFEDFKRRDEKIPGNRRAVPFYYLMSHAIELLLKCALLKRGQSTEDLKKYPIRHSMELLAKQLTNHGVHLSEGYLGIIRDLSRQHEKHVLRYTAMLDDGEITFTPDPGALFEVLDELLMAGRICP